MHIPDGGEPKSRRGRGVTMQDVGRMAGVSQVTVSRALSDPAKVSPDTLRRITQAIEATGFVPNALAGALASRRSGLVTALVPSITNIIYASMVQAFGLRMRDAGYQILLSETGLTLEAEEETLARHLSRRPDAVLLTGIHHTARTRRMLLASGIPVVEVWDFTETPIDACVGFDHAATGRAVGDLAADLGHVQAATVCAGDERAKRRMAGFATQFTRRGGQAVLELGYDDQASLARGRAALARLLDEMGFGRGLVFCSSDILAHGVLIEAQARGLRVPQDIAVVGFGDQEFSDATNPPISTVHVDREAFGRAAAEALLSGIEGRRDGPAAIDLGFRILRRGSA